MRLLVACPKCKRQYDASALEIGARFRCRCGEVLKVEAPRGHDAEVVCCAHCGAPRKEGALSCEYCGAGFTLHDRDLDSVCPHCFTRVSRKAKFCHYCGTRINPEEVVRSMTAMICPACGPGHTLSSRAFDEISLMECGGCTGFWLSHEALGEVTERAVAESIGFDARLHPHRARDPEVDVVPRDTRIRYRPCAICGKLMVKQNYGHASGVIVDVCGKHGVWFDADELPRILDWVHAGGMVWAAETEGAKLDRRQGWAAAEAAAIIANSSEAAPQSESALAQIAKFCRWLLVD